MVGVVERCEVSMAGYVEFGLWVSPSCAQVGGTMLYDGAATIYDGATILWWYDLMVVRWRYDLRWCYDLTEARGGACNPYTKNHTTTIK